MTASVLALLVVGRTGSFTVALPRNGEVTVGRGDDCDVQIPDTTVSRRHLTLKLGEVVEVIDLGSAHGTLMGDRRLLPDVAVVVDGLLSLGSTTLAIRRESADGPTRVSGDAAFEAVCEKARRAGSLFATLDVDVDAPSATATRESIAAAIAADLERVRRLEDTLAESLRPGDVLASLDGDRYALVLFGTPAVQMEAAAAQLRRRLRERGLHARVGNRPVEQDETPPLDDVRPLEPSIDRIAAGTINVLILGETGVGKEVMARTVHARSPRAAAPLVCLNCAAFSESLLESELFGHERGAFTGALAAKPGLLEAADGGTVFLDEIGDMPAALQAKLLRVLEQREVQRVGALRPRAIDVRFVAATNRDLEEESAKGAFRADLYYRLAGVTLRIPPLRERPAELEPLARSFVERACSQAQRPTLRIAGDCLDVLRRYGFPGNIRELRNVMERAVLLCGGDTITIEHLQLPTSAPRRAAEGPARPAPPGPDAALLAEPDERARIELALTRCDGNQTQAASLLGISRRTLVSRLGQYAMPRPRKKS